jgi:hypothetical protein
LIYDYADNRGGPADDPRAMNHLWKCADCRETFSFLLSFKELCARVRADPVSMARAQRWFEDQERHERETRQKLN